MDRYTQGLEGLDWPSLHILNTGLHATVEQRATWLSNNARGLAVAIAAGYDEQRHETVQAWVDTLASTVDDLGRHVRNLEEHMFRLSELNTEIERREAIDDAD